MRNQFKFIMLKDCSQYRIGFDIGSTTAKIVVLDENNVCVLSEYSRHKALIRATVVRLLNKVKETFPNDQFSIQFTGSAGLGIAEKLSFPFVQEVIASSLYVNTKYSGIKTLIDIGGEDVKIIFFEEGKQPDIRMNGSCAGGTGAFIDQMASLLNVDVSDLNALATKSKSIFPIASRCGVFAKTDVQNLLSRKISKEDIAVSVFHAIAIQTINSLARGVDPQVPVLFAGGPLSFIPELRRAFATVLKINSESCILSPESAYIPAFGAALSPSGKYFGIDDIILMIEGIQTDSVVRNRLTPLFESDQKFVEWNNTRSITQVRRNENYSPARKYYLGIDCGSTTSKILVIDDANDILYSKYVPNGGAAFEVVQAAFVEIKDRFGDDLMIESSAVTGYGEDLIKSAFHLDYGIVETIAHFTGARFVDKDVSFILDIGGQDMKAIFIKDGYINNLEINEACSSGCGSFIENFANNLNYSAADFADLACTSKVPCDLGTRCTVFMNSRVKQSLREGADVSDISAGLAYSVIKNCLYKVLKITDISVLGNAIVVQGGSFRNRALVRALENETKLPVKSSNIPELMGAFGAALYAKEQESKPKSILELTKKIEVESKQVHCKACTNNCVITRFEFSNGGVHYSGNKCEKVFSNKGNKQKHGQNIYDYKYDLLFNRETHAINPRGIKIGIPRILGMYESFPFWNALFTHSGIDIVLSAPSSVAVSEAGKGTVMADNICFPAKLAHGHIFDLVDKKVDRIFYPTVIMEEKEHKDSVNSYNCPIVSSYSEVLKSSISIEKRNGIQIDSPAFTFDDKNLLKQACYAYLKQFGVKRYAFEKAFDFAVFHQKNFKEKIRLQGFRILEQAREDGAPVVMLAGRPYHSDILVHQKTSQILAGMGVSVINEEVVPEKMDSSFSDMLVISQWSYPNRIMKAAQFVAKNNDYPIEFVHLNSFGCGPDSFFLDEIKDHLQAYKKTYTLLRVDEMTSGGSLYLRLRSLVESLKLREKKEHVYEQVKRLPVFGVNDKHKTILVPHFSEAMSPMLESLFNMMGYKFVCLPVSDQETVNVGLKYSNNEICFPATLIVGDLIKALQSGKYDLNNVAVSISQTGGQCRASNYISIIKKALLNAGFDNIPVVSVATNAGLINEQPGFEIEWKNILGVVVTGILLSDSLTRLYYGCVSREKKRGESHALYMKYVEASRKHWTNNDKNAMLDLLAEAVRDFNNIECIDDILPRIGIVGEIYLKYNNFANMNVAKWLTDRRIEVYFPDFMDFVIQEFVNFKVNKKSKIKNISFGAQLYLAFLEGNIQKYINKAEKIMSKFHYYRPRHDIYHEAANGAKVIDLVHQFGEGWLIPAEIVSFADQGVQNVISLQPFGCIANHIVSKGIEKKIKDMYPQMNLLFLDFDGSTSEVNIFNRLHFMLENAKDAAKSVVSSESGKIHKKGQKRSKIH